MSSQREASSPVVWPPIIFAVSAIAAALLTWFAGLPFETFLPSGLGLAIGVVVIALGAGMLLLAGRRFNAAGTPIPPNRPTKVIVSEGIYRYSRNPMYLGLALVLLGLGLAFDQLWFIVAMPLAMIAVTKLAIEREEAYLEKKFGAEYLQYKSQVRRWI